MKMKCDFNPIPSMFCLYILSFAFDADFVSAGLGADFVSAGFGWAEVLGTAPISICAIPDKRGLDAGVGLLPAFDVADLSLAMHVSSVCVCASVNETCTSAPLVMLA